MSQRAPRGLGTAAKRLWQAMTAEVTYRPDELLFLEQACKMSDRIAQLEADMEGQPTTVRGSQGQQVINPLIQEIRHLQTAQASLIGRIKLPEEDENQTEKPLTRRQVALKGANARWRMHG